MIAHAPDREWIGSPPRSAVRDFAPAMAEAPRIASYQADPERIGRVLLLYSGGLDTSVMLHWIQARYGAEIITLTVDLGQPGEDWDVIVGKALELGALDAIRADAREEFAHEYVLRAIRANALYGGGYPLFTALARPLIARLAVEHARANGCDTIAHGCTGKGNDQVRIDGTIAALDPGLGVLAPVREWSMGREEEIAYAREHRIPIKGANEAAAPYSIDDNLWGRSSEGRAIEELDAPPPDDVFRLVTRPEQAPDRPELIRVGFEGGRPVTLDGERLGLVELIERVGAIGARHGVGIVDQIEDRIVGLKVRDLYEVPAAAILITAHRDLEALVSTIHQNTFKRVLEDRWAYLCYAGLWQEPLRADLDAYMSSANEHVTGELTVKLYKGQATVVARSSPFALYDRGLASFAESGGEFSQQAGPGFIELFTLQSRMAHRVRDRPASEEDERKEGE
jgi:argininosuccinate synthase